ncbi:hypothetical protein AB4254_11805 [Vibrio breoganii]
MTILSHVPHNFDKHQMLVHLKSGGRYTILDTVSIHTPYEIISDVIIYISNTDHAIYARKADNFMGFTNCDVFPPAEKTVEAGRYFLEEACKRDLFRYKLANGQWGMFPKSYINTEYDHVFTHDG